MTRSMVLAILAFSLLILANLATFGVLGFRKLSEQMVTERLMSGLNEAQNLLMQERRDLEDPYSASEKLAPRLRRFSMFQAVVVLDRFGNVLHRESIEGEVFALNQPTQRASDQPKRSAFQPVNGNLRHMPVQQTSDPDKEHLALEYNEETVRRNIEALRGEFNRKIGIAVGVSLLLLCVGLGYVIHAYKRGQALQEEARKADRMAYVGTLSSGLAHEIRNPLNSMNMNVQLIQEELEEMGAEEHHDILEMLESTRSEVRRLERLVSSFLAYARPTHLAKKPSQINDLIRDIALFIEPEAREAQVGVELNIAEDLPLLPMDENIMRQALLNVIQNGIQVSQKGQTLKISTRKAGGDKILVVIADAGPGISPEELKNIFKEFYSTKVGGTGLGLPIAQRIAELHLGGIKVESVIDKGSTFTFILPMEQSSK